MDDRTNAVGVFTSRSQAQQALQALKQAGFRDDQIGVLSPGADEDAPVLDQATNSRAAEGTAIGAAAGAGAGALWALGIAAGALPVIGPAVAGGLLISVLASAGGAATAGTIVGGLVGLGIPLDEARYYEGEVSAGRSIVTVKAEGRNFEAVNILQRNGGTIRDASPEYATTGRPM